MGFGPFMEDNAGKQAGEAKKAEKRRQNLITQGNAAVNAIFGGGTVPTYSLASGTFDPAGTYYTEKLGAYNPYTIVAQQAPRVGNERGFGNSVPVNTNFDPYAKAKKLFEKGKLYTMSNQQYQGFDPSFYTNREKAYVNYAMPQVVRQYTDVANQVRYGLANRGLSESSTANKAKSDLSYSLTQARQQVGDTARNLSQQTKANVENARQNALQSLYATSDPAQATMQAINAAALVQAPSAFAPVANAFNNLLNQYYARQVLNSYQPYAQQQQYANPQNVS